MKTLWLCVVLLLLSAPLEMLAQASLSDPRVSGLESRIEKLERSGRSVAGAAFVAGVLAALWAQNTRRNAWLWFFFGLILAPIALVVLLYLNARDRDRDPGGPRKRFDLQDFRQQ